MDHRRNDTRLQIGNQVVDQEKKKDIANTEYYVRKLRTPFPNSSLCILHRQNIMIWSFTELGYVILRGRG